MSFHSHPPQSTREKGKEKKEEKKVLVHTSFSGVGGNIMLLAIVSCLDYLIKRICIDGITLKHECECVLHAMNN